MRQCGMDSSSSWTAHGGMTSACAGMTMENELKEHRTFECVQLFNPDLQGTMERAMLRCPLVMPVDGMDECARGVFLCAKRAKVSFSPGPFNGNGAFRSPNLYLVLVQL